MRCYAVRCEAMPSRALPSMAMPGKAKQGYVASHRPRSLADGNGAAGQIARPSLRMSGGVYCHAAGRVHRGGGFYLFNFFRDERKNLLTSNFDLVHDFHIGV